MMDEHDGYRELVSGYALDALDPEDREPIEAHLAGCSDCQTLLAELRHVAAGIGASVDPAKPPPELKARVLTKVTGRAPVPAAETPKAVSAAEPPVVAPVSESRQAPTPKAISAAMPKPQAPRRGLGLAFAAALAGVAAIGSYAWTLRTELETVRGSLTETMDRLDSTRSELATARQNASRLTDSMSVLRAPDVQRMELRVTGPTVPGPTGRAFVSLTRGIVFDAENLPVPAPGRAYQLWLVPPGYGAAPVSAGMLAVDPSGRSTMQVEVPTGLTTLAAVAVSDEPMGGSPQPTTAPFLVGLRAFN
jgi:anti-sigma-K factor RskA